MPRRPTPMQWRFIRAYIATDPPDHISAARRAGFKRPSEAGLRMVRRLGVWIESEREKLKQTSAMPPSEVLAGLEEIARDKEHRSRYDALVALAKIHGLIDAKSPTPADKKKLTDSVEEIVRAVTVAPKQLRRTPNIEALPDS